MTLTPRSREEQLEQLVAKAPKGLAPERDLWLTIEKRMDKPLNPKADASKHGRPLWPQWAMAAALVLAPSLNGQLQLLAGDSIYGGELTVSRSSAIPSIFGAGTSGSASNLTSTSASLPCS